VAQITFHGHDLMAAPGVVMTPRSTSERLVDAAVAIAGGRPARIADVGTGSGAIAVALAARLPQAEIYATDTSAEAVSLARANAARLGLGERVTVLHGSLLEPVPGSLDLIVANLPYLPAHEAGRHSDLDGEPPDAVFAPGDGLGPYRALVAGGWERLDAGGTLLMQLRRRVLAARRGELDVLASALALAA
jgi:release factor glutamine methyltransferase